VLLDKSRCSPSCCSNSAFSCKASVAVCLALWGKAQSLGSTCRVLLCCWTPWDIVAVTTHYAVAFTAAATLTAAAAGTPPMLRPMAGASLGLASSSVMTGGPWPAWQQQQQQRAGQSGAMQGHMTAAATTAALEIQDSLHLGAPGTQVKQVAVCSESWLACVCAMSGSCHLVHFVMGCMWHGVCVTRVAAWPCTRVLQ
jgi:hypothetical protein